MHAHFYLHNNFFKWQFFLCGCTFTFVTSDPTGRMVFFADANLQQLKGLVPHEPTYNPWKSLHSNRSRAVLVLSSPKTYHNIFFECFDIYWTILDIWFSRSISCKFMLYLYELNPFCFDGRDNQISDMSIWSDQHCLTERVCYLGLSLQFVSISRFSPLQTNTNWWYHIRHMILLIKRVTNKN